MYGPWLSNQRTLDILHARVLVREVTGRYPRMLITAPLTDLYLNNKSIINIVCNKGGDFSPWVITGILNSSLVHSFLNILE